MTSKPSLNKLSSIAIKKLEDKIYFLVMEYTIQMMLNNAENKFQLYDKASEPALKSILECIMLLTSGNQSESARILGMSRGTLRVYLKKYFGRHDVGLFSAKTLENFITEEEDVLTQSS